MIKRVKKIVGVGPFVKFETGGKFEFGRLTVIFGLNTYGKSTLTDIFRSLKERDNVIIGKRKTIGANKQEVEISFEHEGKENIVKFDNKNWNGIFSYIT